MQVTVARKEFVTHSTPAKEKHRLQTLWSNASSEWGTPQEFFAKLNAAFNFTLDPCANETNHKCPAFFTKADDGLAWPWFDRVFMNPPYGRGIGDWIQKAWEESEERGVLVVCLVPARTDTKWFAIAFAHARAITFVPGRLKFEIPGKKSKTAPFPSALLVFGNFTSLSQSLVLQEIGPTWRHVWPCLT